MESSESIEREKKEEHEKVKEKVNRNQVKGKSRISKVKVFTRLFEKTSRAETSRRRKYRAESPGKRIKAYFY